MITHIQVATLYVSDQDKALDFYTSILGMSKRVDMPLGPGYRWVEVAPEGAQTSISLARPADPAQTPSGFTGFILNTDDVHAFYQTMKSRGVDFSQEPTAQPWGGIQASFSDPDGNRFLIAQRTS